MAAAATPGFQFEAPREHFFAPSALLALAVHVLLAAALMLGVHWQSRAPDVVTVELWRPPPEPVAQPAPPPKVVKPPREEPKRGLPEPDAKPSRKKPEKTPTARAAAPTSERGRSQTSSTGASPYSGLDLVGPAGPGVPGGTDPMGDWYLAGVQRKIWMIWTQQIRGDFSQSVTVAFTILADGSLDPDVQVIQSSGVSLLDNAAKRAIYSAAPFAPLPKDYGKNRFTIEAVFKPTPNP